MKMKRLLSALLCAVLLMTSVTVLAATNEATPGEATRCDHVGSTIVDEQRDVTYTQDATTHTKSYNLVKVHTCPSCEAGDYEDKPVSTTDPAEDHSFADGKCSVCGYVCPHASHDDAGICSLCHVTCGHSFADGKCTVCGACEHKNVRTFPTQRNRKVEVVDGKYHLVSYDAYEATACSDCGRGIGEEKLVEEGVQQRSGHYYKDGDACMVCGYTNTGCAHEHIETQTYWEPVRVISTDASNHTVQSNLVKQEVCLDCNRYSAIETLEEGLIITGPHEMGYEVCYVCNYRPSESCAHAEAEEETYYEWTEVVSKDASGHTMKGTKVTEKHCLNCGEYFDAISEKNQTVTGAHDFYIDRCTVCDYLNPCKHETTHTETAYSMTYDFTPTADGHSFKGCELEDVWCDVCESLISEKIVAPF